LHALLHVKEILNIGGDVGTHEALAQMVGHQLGGDNETLREPASRSIVARSAGYSALMKVKAA